MSDQNIEQLRAEAAAHRQSIATDLELMGDRVSPSRIAERRKARLRERVYGMRNSVFGTSERTRRPSASYTDDADGSPASSAQWQSGGVSSDPSTSVGDRASGALDAVKQHTPDSLGEVTEGSPLAAAVVGFGIGMLAATVLPSSPDEQRAARKLQPHLESSAATLGQTGKEAVENIKPEAQQAVADVKDSAKESVESVKSDAQSAAESVKGTAQSKTEEVRSQA